MHSKGQLISTELVISSTIFVAALIVLFFSWNMISSSYFEEQTQKDMQTILLGISDMVVLSPGYPSNWEQGDIAEVNAFGFASSRNVLSASKLSALAVLEGYYPSAKEKMGAGPFDVSITVMDANSGSILYSFGRSPPQTAPFVSVSAERLALLEKNIVRVRVEVWKKK
ncbi:MAG: hypothetical protein N3G80_02205 [Candidatus Micrarchaeota archaeon]|nr:hypothetical protein [Candidatus Micrarchaeota archaeon]